MNFQQRMYEHEFQMNDTDDEIADYLLRNRGRLKDLSIQKIAADLFVAPNAIMRLSKKLGYSGFAELKFSLIREEPETGKTDRTVGGDLMASLPENIARTLDVIDEAELQKAAEMIRAARCCILAGGGDSIPFCEILGKNLRCVDVTVQYFMHIHDMIYTVRHGEKDDVLLVISARGRNDRLLKLAETAHEKGMKVISLTHFDENPQAETADCRLYFWGRTQILNDYNITDRSGLMVLVRLLSETFWAKYAADALTY